MKLPLFQDPGRPPEEGGALSPLEASPARPWDSGCVRCPLALGCATVCMKPTGKPGGVLLVVDYPSRMDDKAGKPLNGQAGAWVHGLVRRFTQEPVLVDHAVRCSPAHGQDVPAKAVSECRGYLAHTVEKSRPARIVVMGRVAAEAVLGRRVQPLNARRGFAYLPRLGIPVFIVQQPQLAARNRFLKGWFEHDLRWALTARPPFDPAWTGTYAVVTSAAEAEEAERELRAAPWVGFDGEWRGEPFNRDFRLLAVGVGACDMDHAWIWDRDALADPVASAPLRRLMVDPGVRKTGHNAKADILCVGHGLGLEVDGLHLDTQVVRHLLETDVDAALDDVAELVGMGGYKAEAEAARQRGIATLRARRRALASGSGVQASLFSGGGDFPWMGKAELDYLERAPRALEDATFALIPPDVLYRYNGRDVVCTNRAGLLIEDELASRPHLQRHWDLVVREAVEAYAQIEAWGVRVDRGSLHLLADYVAAQDEQVLARFRGAASLPAGGEFNIESGAQVADLLYNKLGLRPPFLTEGGRPSTDADALEKLLGKHPCVEHLAEHRRLAKFKADYAGRVDGGEWVGGLAAHIRDDGCVHTTFKIDGARSGRTSSADPNLQNITKPDEDHPDDKPEGKMLRDAFIADPGTEFIDIDYKQLEYRVAAALTGDPEMLKAIKAGDDFHLETAKLVSQLMWGIPPEEVTKKHRRPVKAINFGLFYGKGDEALAAELGITVEEAAKVRAAILGKFRKLADSIQWAESYARQTGTARTWWDGQLARERQLWRIASPDGQEAGNAKRAAFNTFCQGTGNDICMRAATKIVQWIKANRHPAKLRLTVHDSVLLTCPKPLVSEMAGVAASIMRSIPAAGVPLDVDAEHGERWGSMEKLKLAA